MVISLEQVSRVAGKNLFEVMSRVLAKDAYQAVVELTANSYDSDSARVDITLDERTQNITIIDDGEGMDEQGLEDFFRLGGSSKLENRITAKGRRTMGHYGVATILLRFIANEYTLTTVHDGLERIIVDDFEQDSAAALHVQTKPAPNLPNGTRIEITKPKYRIGSNHFNAKDLKHRLGWEIPQSSDFIVSVNGDEFESRLLSNAIEYQFSRDLGRVGPIDGSFYFFQFLRPRNKGIWVYINRRSVGNPLAFNLEEIEPVFGNRMFAKINAPGLEDSVTFDRNSFQETPEFREFYDFVRDYARTIASDITSRKVELETERVFTRLGDIVERIKSDFLTSSNWTGEKPDIEFSDYKKSGPLATYHPKTNTFYLNAQHPLLEYSPGARRKTRQNYYQQFILIAIAHALAKQKSPIFSTSMDEIAEQAMEYAAVGSRKVIRHKTDLHPERLFSMYDLERFAGIPRTVAHELFADMDRIDKVTKYKIDAREMNRVLQELKGLVPMHELLTEVYAELHLDVDRRQSNYRAPIVADQLIQSGTKGIIGWPEHNPVYFIKGKDRRYVKTRILELPQFNG